MYPNLYYVFKDWFGVEWSALKILNTFGLMVALAFVAAAIVLSAELKRKEKQGLLFPREETIIVGKPASMWDFLFNGIVGFVFGYKLFGLILNKAPEITTQDYVFSRNGNVLGGFVLAALLVGLKWWDKKKQTLKQPEKRSVRIWPHDRVGDIVIIALIFGILGAKLFDNFEHWDEFMQDPLGKLFSVSGLTFYGGLILAAIAVCRYAYKKQISLSHLVDAAAPALMIAYAIGRIGCQVSGDGDWGIYNSAYTSDAYGKVTLAAPGDFEKTLVAKSDYFLYGRATADPASAVTDRVYPSLKDVPHRSVKGPSFLPTWLFAYSFPQNVNNDGIPIPGVKEEHYSVLPQPVFPTSLYETIICTFLFGLLWMIRKRVRIPLVMFGIYLFINGVERFFIETIRVNITYSTAGIPLTQAEIIALILMLSGLVTIFFAWYRSKKQ